VAGKFVNILAAVFWFKYLLTKKSFDQK